MRSQLLDDHATILRRLDISFAIAAIAVSLGACVLAYLGHMRTFGAVGVCVWTVLNLGISRVSTCASNPLAVELFRSTVFAVPVAVSLLIWTDGPFSPFWLPLLVHSIFSSVLLYAFSDSRKLSYVLIPLWFLPLILANGYLDKPLTTGHVFLICMVILMVNLFFVEMVCLLKLSHARNAEYRDKLMRESRLSAIGEMAGGIAHEINNPLAVIYSTSELLENALEQENPDLANAQELNQTVQNVSERISKILAGLTRISRKTDNDQPVSFSVNKTIDETLTLCQARFQKARIETRWSQGNEPDHYVLGRPVEISQVLLNLLNNSFDAIESKDEKWVEISTSDSRDFVSIRVTDSGDGLSQSVAEQVFQPFFTTKEPGKGTGLGLSVSKSLMESNGGTLSVDQNSNHTAFEIRLKKFSEETNDQESAS